MFWSLRQCKIICTLYCKFLLLESLLVALSSALEVMWSIMALFMLFVVAKYARDFYMENANF